MAVHKIVYVSKDRHWRISSDPAGKRFTVEKDLVLQAKLSSLPDLEKFLRGQGIELSDLVQD